MIQPSWLFFSLSDMPIMKKIIIILLSLIIVVVAGSVLYLKVALPDVGNPPDLTIHSNTALVKRGAYLATHVAVCIDCHSTRDWSRFSGPIIPGTLGKGGEYFGPEMGFPGKFYSRNLTPFNLKNWTDGEIFRAITSGVDKDGVALFPVMPYLHYGKMDKEDVYAIIAYLRTLKSIENTPPPSSPNFPMNLIINTIPQKPAFSHRPNPSSQLQYGAYLVNVASCMECHTKVKEGKIIPSLAFSGGRNFEMPNGTVSSANITPDKQTGIGNWTEADFVARFKDYEDSSATYILPPHAVNTIMPWAMYAGMDTTDLKAIYAYLRTVKPIKNNVVHFQPKKV